MQVTKELKNQIIAKYGNTVPKSGLSQKNGYAKKKTIRLEMNEVLKANGFRWEKDGGFNPYGDQENENVSWSLVDENHNNHEPLDVLVWLYSQSEAFLIPKKGGKIKKIPPENSYNLIKFCIEYGVVEC